MDQMWVQQVRRLLAKAKVQHSRAFDDLDGLRASIDGALKAADAARAEAMASTTINLAPYPMRRKAAMARVALKNKHYGLLEETEAFFLAAGVSTLHGLDADQLEALDHWLAGFIEHMDTACDWVGTPPAR